MADPRLERTIYDRDATPAQRDAARAEYNRQKYMEGEAATRWNDSGPGMFDGLLGSDDDRRPSKFYGVLAIGLVLMIVLNFLAVALPSQVAPFVHAILNVGILATIGLLVLIPLLKLLFRLFLVVLVFVGMLLGYLYMYPNG